MSSINRPKNLLHPKKIKREMRALAELQGLACANNIHKKDNLNTDWLVTQMTVTRLVIGFQSLMRRKSKWKV